MTVGPARRRRSGSRPQRAIALLSAAGLATAPLLVGATAAADPSPGTTQLPVNVVLASVRPFAPQPGDTLRLTGELHNTSVSAIGGLSMRLLESPSYVGERSTFDDYANTPDGPPPVDAVQAASAVVNLPRPQLPAGGAERFTVTVPVDSLAHPTPWEVYELALVVDGVTSDPTGLTTAVGQLRTFLPWAPVSATGSTSPRPLQVAWVWPLADQPHRDATWIDDSLATELADGGRLRELVDAGLAAETQHRPPPTEPKHEHGKHGKHGKDHAPPPPPPTPKTPLQPVPLTWAIDPMLVEDATLMRSGSAPADATDAQRASGQAAAKAWLAEVQHAVRNGSVLALPYGDPDLTAEVRAGLTAQLQRAMTEGQSLLTHVLGRTALAYAWPPDGYTDERTLDALFARGVTTVVLDSAALPPLQTPSADPSARTRFATTYGHLNVLLADHTLNTAIDTAATDPTLAGATVQRVLSELLMLQAETPFPTTPRDFVLEPDRRWAPAPSMARDLVAATGRVPWIDPVRLSDVAASTTDTTTARATHLALPPDERSRLLSSDYLHSVASIDRSIALLGAIIQPLGNPLPRQLDEEALRLLSSAWRDAPDAAAAARDRVQSQVAQTLGQVRIASHANATVTLTSHSGTVPVTVANELDSPVRVTVEAHSDNQLVTTSEPTTQTVPAHSSFPVDVHVTAQGSGVFPLTVQLFTPSNGPEPHHAAISKPVELSLKATAYGATALLITGGASGVLFLAVIVRLFRRGRSSRSTRVTP